MCASWRLEYEESTDGWVLLRWREDKHNHELKYSQAEIRASSATRGGIPERFHVFGRVMSAAGSPPAVIHRTLREFAKKEGLDPTWELKDVQRLFSPSIKEKQFDVSGLIDCLRERESLDGLPFFVQTDCFGALSRVFFTMEDGFDEYALGGDLNVVLLDATHGTNRYNFKLVCFTTVSSCGQTVILAGALLAAEDIESYEWALQCFLRVFRKAPLALFTDSDVAIAEAFRRLNSEGEKPMAGTRHCLCTYHLSKNLWKHCCCLYLTAPTAWRKVPFFRHAHMAYMHAQNA